MKESAESYIQRLPQAVDSARFTFERARRNRWDLIRATAGFLYGERMKMPDHVNLLSLYDSIIGRSLVAKNPQFNITTFNRKYQPHAEIMTAWGNNYVRKINLDNTLRRCVLDSLNLMGICKVGIATPGDAAMFGYQFTSGRVMARTVDFDDWVHDPNAPSLEECDYLGHRYRIQIDIAKDAKWLNANRKKLEPACDRDFNRDGDMRIATISRGYYDADDLYDYVDLWEIALPQHRLIVTFDEATGNVLRIEEWKGPRAHPYKFLAMMLVPGNSLPKGPKMDLAQLHHDYNNTYRKANQMIRDLKELLIGPRNNDGDAKAIKAARSGDILGLDAPADYRNVITGGQAVQAVMAIAEMYRKLFSFIAGNLELLGGRGQQASTLGQEEMLNANAGASIQDMYDYTVKFASEVGHDIFWWAHHDPDLYMTAGESAPGLPNIVLKRQLGPWKSEGMNRRFSWDELDFKIEEYSLGNKTPAQRMAMIDRALTQVVAPMMPILQQTGQMPDMNEYFRIASRYSDMPEFLRLMNVIEPPPTDEEGAGPSHQRMMPAKTERTYTRKSSANPNAGDDNMAAAMLGVDMGGSGQSENSMMGM